MELLLNLVWTALVIGSFFWATLRPQQNCRKGSQWRSLLVLGCALLLLFPVISASDDLHPAQAVMEDATRRVLHLVPSMHLSPAASAGPVLVLLLSLGSPLALVKLQSWIPQATESFLLDGHSLLAAGRAPPFRSGS
jgi:hypothetical protein